MNDDHTLDEDLARTAHRIEILFAATQLGQVEAFAAWQETVHLLTPLYAEIRAARRQGAA